MEQVEGVLTFDRFALDLTRGILRVADEEIVLRPKTFEVLRHLAQNAGRLVSRQELHEAVWPKVAVTDNSLEQCVFELREKLADSDHRLIKTVPRRGYRLDAQVAGSAAISGSPNDRLRPTSFAADTSRRISIVVLPFRNLSGDPAQDYFGDGIAEDLTTDLACLPETFVIAPSTAFTFKTSQVGAKVIGGELDVRFSNRPFGVKHFQAIRRRSVDVVRGLVLLSGIGTKAVPSWDPRTRWNDLLVGLAIRQRQAQADMRSHLIHRPARDIIPPLGGARVSSYRV